LQDLHKKKKYHDVKFKLRNTINDEIEEISGLYVICDGGYHKWRCMQCPVKFSSQKDVCEWSRWLESVRKDIECTFGILKGRFRILKIPCLLQKKEEIDNTFWTCCIMHNKIMNCDNKYRAWEKDMHWNAEDGLHAMNDLEDNANALRRVAGQLQRLNMRVSRSLDMSSMGSSRAPASTAQDLVEERTVDHAVLRNKLVEHFARQKNDNKLKWGQWE